VPLSEVGKSRTASGRFVQLSAIKLTRIVAEIHVIDAQRTDSRYLGDLLTRLCPVEMGRVAGQNDDATGRISLHLIAVELVAETDVENARQDRVDTILRVPVRHEFHAGRHFDPYRVRARRRGLRRTEGGNAGNGFQSISSGRIDLKTVCPG